MKHMKGEMNLLIKQLADTMNKPLIPKMYWYRLAAFAIPTPFVILLIWALWGTFLFISMIYIGVVLCVYGLISLLIYCINEGWQ